MAAWMIDAFGGEAQRHKFLPKLCTHGAFRELLPDRAGLRLRRRKPQDARDARRRPLRAERHEGLHLGRRRLGRLCLHGAHRRGRPARHLLHRGGEGHAGALLRRAGEEARLEVAADRDGDVRGLPRAGGKPDRQRGPGLQDRDGRARRRTAQHRGLLDRRRAVLPRPHHRVHARAQAVRHAARGFPGAGVSRRRLCDRAAGGAADGASRRERRRPTARRARRGSPRRPSASPPTSASTR